MSLHGALVRDFFPWLLRIKNYRMPKMDVFCVQQKEGVVPSPKRLVGRRGGREALPAILRYVSIVH